MPLESVGLFVTQGPVDLERPPDRFFLRVLVLEVTLQRLLDDAGESLLSPLRRQRQKASALRIRKLDSGSHGRNFNTACTCMPKDLPLLQGRRGYSESAGRAPKAATWKLPPRVLSSR